MYREAHVVTPESNGPSKVRTFFRPPIEKTFVEHVKLGGVAGQDERPNNIELPADTPSGHFNSLAGTHLRYTHQGAQVPQ